MTRLHNEALGGIEAGGTTFVCAVGNRAGEFYDSEEFPTSTPEDTYDQVNAFFDRYPEVQAIGVAHFGPFDLDPTSPTYGSTLATPKAGWNGADVLGLLRERRGPDLPIGFMGDVDGALRGEYAYGHARGQANSACIYVGTGIGAAALVNGVLVGGAQGTPEMGHQAVGRVAKDSFEGACSAHGDCLEGLASGGALETRWRAGEDPENPEVWAREAEYLRRGVGNIALMHRPTVVIMGGGVFKRPDLFEAVDLRVNQSNQGYIKLPELVPASDPYIGVRGAINLAVTALQGSE